MPKVRIDLSETKERGEFSPRHVEEGEYLFTIKNSVLKQPEGKTAYIEFRLESPQIRGASYPYRAFLSGSAAFRFRNLLEAVGVTTRGKSALAFDTDRLHGKQLAASVIDHEYQGKMSSEIDQLFPASMLDDADTGSAVAVADDEDVAVEPDEEEAVVEEAPAARKRPARPAAKPAPAVEPDEDDLDLDEI